MFFILIIQIDLLSLNPCYSGITSLRLANRHYVRLYQRLNPCYSGITSLRNKFMQQHQHQCCLNPCYSGITSLRLKTSMLLME